MSSAMVTFNGRITLPFHVRKQLDLKTGDSVDFVEIEKGRFSILPGQPSIAGAGLRLNHDSDSEEMDESAD